MKLFLVRHGDAVNSDVDPERPLSEAGKKVVSKVGRHLKGLGIQVDQIRCSVKARARQTAQIIAGEITPGQPPSETQGFKPNDSVEPVARDLEAEERDTMIVGHLPFLPTLAARLLGESKPPEPLGFPTAGVVALVRNEEGVWSAEFQIWPEQIADKE
jgi:phosphohistidine phosphatase